MEITARDLRIGNLIQWSGNYFQVLIIEKDFVYIKKKNLENKFLRFDKNEVKPIPLTEDWLQRLPEDLVSEDIPSWIKYLHQLQNWYWIRSECKTELTLTK